MCRCVEFLRIYVGIYTKKIMSSITTKKECYIGPRKSLCSIQRPLWPKPKEGFPFPDFSYGE